MLKLTPMACYTQYFTQALYFNGIHSISLHSIFETKDMGLIL